jgi:hypothetical protein
VVDPRGKMIDRLHAPHGRFHGFGVRNVSDPKFSWSVCLLAAQNPNMQTFPQKTPDELTSDKSRSAGYQNHARSCSTRWFVG